MIETSEQEIIAKAKWLNLLGRSWHSHLLTPKCIFNSKANFALVLESSVDNSEYANYSETKQEASSKLLLELLHGIKTDGKKTSLGSEKVSEAVRKMETRAKELTEKKVPWHHHALFPNCIFNDHKGKWKIMLEDPETGKAIESITEGKPDGDLKVIEPLFYAQKI